MENKIKKELPSGSTPITSEDLRGLIPKHITTKEELFDAEFINTSQAYNKYFLSKKKFYFSTKLLYKVHKDMFDKIWKWAGEPRKTERNIGVESIYVEVELKKLLDDLDFWKNSDMTNLEISARLHHRLVFIHPFNNGNGRWARLIVNLFLKDHLNSYIHFPEDKFLLEGEIRKEYVRTLKHADKGNYEPLIYLHKKYLKVIEL